MSVTKDSLKEAQDAARDARTKLADTFGEIKARLQPGVLVREAQDKVREEAVELGERAAAAAREKPAAAGLAVGAFILLLIRKPLGRLIGRVFSKPSETAGPAAG
jgi:hypothetical protein